MFKLLDSIFIFFGICFIIEQIFYLFPGSYPYRYGIKVQTIPLPVFDISYWDSIKTKINTLSIKTRSEQAEVYLKYKYSNLVIGPSLFVGQIKRNDSMGVLHVRVGPLSALFVLFLLAYPFFSSDIFTDPLFQLMNILILIVVVVYFYFRLFNQINSLILNKSSP